jgi:hypothetical protein
VVVVALQEPRVGLVLAAAVALQQFLKSEAKLMSPVAPVVVLAETCLRASQTHYS